jgi:hypothetical protein
MEYQFDNNTKDFSNIKKIKGFTKDVVSLTDDDYDIILIDADHSYNGVKQDILNYKDKGKYLLFHDYDSNWTGVKQAVDEFNFVREGLMDRLLLVRAK